MQTELYLASRRLVERGARWLLHYRPQPIAVAATVAQFAIPVTRLSALATVSPFCQPLAARYASQGVPTELAHRVAALEELAPALDIAELAAAHGVEVEDAASTYNEVGEHLVLHWLAERIYDLPRADRWDALARNALREDAASQHRRIADAVMAAGSYAAWAEPRALVITRAQTLLDEMRQHAVFDVATLSVALRELRSLL